MTKQSSDMYKRKNAENLEVDFASGSALEGSLAQQLREQEAQRDKQSESKPCTTRHFFFTLGKGK